MKIDTFSANSLKILDKDPNEFRLKYIEGISLNPDNSAARQGQNLHSYLCFYLKNFDMSKIENTLVESDRAFIEKIKEYEVIKTLKTTLHKDIEQPFFVKCNCSGTSKGTLQDVFYLTGRFDAVLHQTNPENSIQIFDWKTQSLPKDPENDIQTVVYLYAASKLYHTEDISLTYLTLAKNETATVAFNPSADYLSRISNILIKLG